MLVLGSSLRLGLQMDRFSPFFLFKDDIRRLDGSKTERQSIQKLEESHLVKDLGLGIKRKNSFILT